jgi:hypothetical protein
MSLRLLVGFTVALTIGVVVACSSSDDKNTTPADYTGSCAELASRCHPIKTPLGIECHELGHTGDDAKCGPRKAECLAECPVQAEDDGGKADGSSTTNLDGGADAADAGGPCADYCVCMATTCSDQPDYPYADEAACLVACNAFTAEDRTCHAAACEEAKTAEAEDKDHECMHASGAIACH